MPWGDKDLEILPVLELKIYLQPRFKGD